jgi:hypothetical protein
MYTQRPRRSQNMRRLSFSSRQHQPKTDGLCPSGILGISKATYSNCLEREDSPCPHVPYPSLSKACMDDRITQVYDDEKTALPKDEFLFNHGYLSLNIKPLDDGHVVIYNLDMALWGPPDWVLFSLSVSSYEVRF